MTWNELNLLNPSKFPTLTEFIRKWCMVEGEYSVCQFFMDGSYEYVRRFVDINEAADAFRFYTNNVATRMGITVRVIITDGGDLIIAEWKHGEGLVFPEIQPTPSKDK